MFSAEAPAGGKAVKSVTAKYPASQAKFVWNAKAKAFDVLLDKKPARATEGGNQHATTVVVQYVRQHDSGYGDKFGGKTPMLETVGTGKGWVLRDGRAYAVTWARSAAASGTTFTGADGQPCPSPRARCGSCSSTTRPRPSSPDAADVGPTRQGWVSFLVVAGAPASPVVRPPPESSRGPDVRAVRVHRQHPGDRHRPRQARARRDAQGRRHHGRRHRRAGQDRRGRRRRRRHGARARARRHPRPGRRRRA